MAFKSVFIPLTVTYLPSPWSFSTDIPEILLRDSATFISAKLPKASESMTPTFLSESLFLLRALLRLAREPTTTTSSSA